MRKQYWIALSLALGLFSCSPNSPETVATLSPSPPIATTPSPSSSPKPEVPKATLDAFNNLKRTQEEFTNELENAYLFNLQTIATVQSSNDSKSSQSDSNYLVNYAKPKEKLNAVLNSSKELFGNLPSDPQLRKKINESLTPLNNAIQSMQKNVLDPLSEPSSDKTENIGVAKPEAVEKVQTNLSMVENASTVKKGEYQASTHSEVAKFLRNKNKILEDQISAIEKELFLSSAQDGTRDLIVNGLTVNPVIVWSIISSILTSAVLTTGFLFLAHRFKRSQAGNDGKSSTELSSDQEHQIIERLITILDNRNFNQTQTGISTYPPSSSNIEKQHQTLVNQVQQQLVARDKEFIDLKKEFDNLKAEAILVSSSRKQAPYSTSSTPPNITQFDPSPVADAIDEPADQYKINPSKFTPIDIVSLNQESLENLRQAKSDPLVLDHYDQGNCRVISDAQNKHYLIPKESLKLNENNIKSLENLYDFMNQVNFSVKPELMKLAKVRQIDGGWELVKRGELRF